MNNPFKKLSTALLIAVFTFCHSYSVMAAPGVLPTSPLFLSSAVEPNVYFTYDDSGSMEWETIVADGTGGFTAISGRPVVRGFTIEFYAPSWEHDSNVMPPEALEPGTWIFRNHNGNKNYYNPDVEYKPWEGNDLLGNPLFEDAVDYPEATGHTFTVPEDPYTANPDTLDLVATYGFFLYPPGDTSTSTLHNGVYYIPTYYIWPDTEGDGVIETTDAKTLVEIKPGNAPFSYTDANGDPQTRSYVEEINNFANWFMYYRTREFAAKAGIGAVINGSESVRMGMDAFHGDLIQNLASMSDATNKFNLLNDFYEEGSGGGTPVHEALKRVGDRFINLTDGTTIVSQADGGECQQNFNILMSDGFWNSFVNPNVGNADSSATADGGFDGDATESNDGGNYEDAWSNTVADMAMYYYETDLSALANRVPVPDDLVIPAGSEQPNHQHLVTYTIGFGLDGTLDSSLDPATAPGFTWPDPMDTEDEERVDDLWHAAYNSRGLFLSADNPQELAASLDTAIADIAAQTATASAASVTSAQLTVESTLYLAEFNTEGWHGTIYAYGIKDPATGELNATADWSAAEKLAEKAVSDRVILTFDTDGIPFKWDSLNTAMKNDLRTKADGSLETDPLDTNAKMRLDYIRGDHSNEGSGNDDFRQRATLTTGDKTRLGDIINSGPVYVGKPAVGWPEEFPVNNPSTPYSGFETAQENRNGVVYVGANDGMLHGFDGDTGEELLAYIPSNLFSTDTDKGLHYLTQQDYSHLYYNDLTPSISDVFINGSWHTVLIGGQRAGGQGYFALDITDPTSFNEGNAANIAMWEFTHEDLGFTYSRPQIGMMNDGTWVAIFGNGYNHTGVSTATGGKAQLFIVNIATGALIKTIVTNDGATAAARNGLATPALADLDGNGTIDRAYAGDLQGNLWAFDLSAATSASWGLAYTDPLFVTEGSQPITAKPSLSFHPTEITVEAPDTNANEPNLMVFFGSGQYLVDADKSPSPANYFYGVWDKGVSNLNRSNLVDQTISTATFGGIDFRILSQNAVDYTDTTVFGWNINLPDSGERIITNSAVRGTNVFFNSSVPTDDPCTTGGYGFRFGVDVATGGTPDSPVFDTNEDGVVDSGDTISGSSGVIQSIDTIEGLPTDNTLTDNIGYNKKDPFILPPLDDLKEGRFSWQELLQ